MDDRLIVARELLGRSLRTRRRGVSCRGVQSPWLREKSRKTTQLLLRGADCFGRAVGSCRNPRDGGFWHLRFGVTADRLVGACR